MGDCLSKVEREIPLGEFPFQYLPAHLVLPEIFPTLFDIVVRSLKTLQMSQEFSQPGSSVGCQWTHTTADTATPIGPVAMGIEECQVTNCLVPPPN